MYIIGFQSLAKPMKGTYMTFKSALERYLVELLNQMDRDFQHLKNTGDLHIRWFHQYFDTKNELNFTKKTS
jgi:hypothetical protein